MFLKPSNQYLSVSQTIYLTIFRRCDLWFWTVHLYVCIVLQASSLLKGETALTPKAWPVPVFSGLSPSPAWRCRLCVTGEESRAAGTRSAVSPRCVACMAFPLRGICQVWRKASSRPLFATPAASSPPESRPLCTRLISTRGAGTLRAYHSVLLLHRPSQWWGQSSSPAAVDLRPSRKLLQLSPRR